MRFLDVIAMREAVCVRGGGRERAVRGASGRVVNAIS